MAAFEKIRISIGSRILEKKRKKLNRRKTVQNFHSAKNTAIIFDATDPESFRQIKEFRKFLESSGIKTELLGYVNGEEIPNDLLLWDNCQILSRKDLDLFRKPREEKTGSFISRDFDILFDLSSNDPFPVEYIVKLSNAKFKTGRFREAPNDYDLMINTGSNKEVNFLIEQMKKYINMLNNPIPGY